MKKITPILENKAVDLYALNPNIKHGEVAEKLGITNKTLMSLRKKPDFWAKVYDTFCVHLEGELPSVVRAMTREALAGNTQAGRLILEWSGKLQKTLNVNVSSPFEKWLALENQKDRDKISRANVHDAEIVIDELPESTADNSPAAIEQEFRKVNKELIKKEKWLKRRQELYSWSRRAELVGIAPLPPKRPTKGQRLDWEKSIVRAEQEQS